MNAGSLDRTVTLQTAAAGQTASGAPTQSWVTVATVRAARRDTTGRERMLSNREQADQDAVFTVRRGVSVTPSWRLVEGSTVYDILAVGERGKRGEWLDLSCRRVAA